LAGGADTDTLITTAAADISGATVSGFEALTGDFTVSMTSAQYTALTAKTNSARITLTDAGATVTMVAGAPLLTTANGVNVVTASVAANYNIVGGTGIDTFNFGATLTAGDTVAGGTGVDVLNITGTAAGSGNITAVETFNVNYATAGLTFTTGAIAATSGTITAAASTAGVTIVASDFVPTTTLTIIDGPANDLITVPTADAARGITTVTLAGGGSDTVTVNDAATGVANTAVAITGFSSGIAAGSDKLVMQLGGVAAAGGYTIITAPGQAVNKAAMDNGVIEINSVVGVVTDFTATAANLAVEQLVATAIGTATGANLAGWVIVYGGGAQGGNAAVYSYTHTGTDVDVTAATVVVELLATLTGIAADSMVSSNFI